MRAGGLHNTRSTAARICVRGPPVPTGSGQFCSPDTKSLRDKPRHPALLRMLACVSIAASPCTAERTARPRPEHQDCHHREHADAVWSCFAAANAATLAHVLARGRRSRWHGVRHAAHTLLKADKILAVRSAPSQYPSTRGQVPKDAPTGKCTDSRSRRRDVRRCAMPDLKPSLPVPLRKQLDALQSLVPNCLWMWS